MENNKRIIVFTGLSLSFDDASQILDADYRPPVKRGDIFKILKEEEKPEPITVEIDITVGAVSSAVVEGNTVYYIKATDGKIYTVGIGVSSDLPFIKAGDSIKASVDTENNVIKSIN